MAFRDGVRRGFFALLVRPFLRFVVGVRLTGRENLPAGDPFLLVANHDSHLDTPLLLSLFPGTRLARIHPVGAADYWFRSRGMAFVATTFFNVLPIERTGKRDPGEDPLAPLEAALRRGESLVVFPEGTRGEPEKLERFKSGAARLAHAVPEVPVVPVHLHGAGRSLPRGTGLFVPFICDVRVGAPIPRGADVKVTQRRMEDAVRALAPPAPEAPTSPPAD